MAYLIADLKALTTDPEPLFKSVMVLGLTAIDDGGGGIYHWNAIATNAGDDAEWVVPNDNATTGRWQRITKNIESSSDITTANEAGTAVNSATADADVWKRWTAAGTKTLTIVTGQHVSGNVLHGINVGAGLLTIAAGAGVTLTGTSLTYEQNRSYAVVFSSATAADVITSPDAVTLAGARDYLTIADQVITRNAVDLATDITGNLPIANLASGTGATATTFFCGNDSWAVPAGTGGYTAEEAQDAVGTILVDSSSINFTYTDATPEITAAAIFGSTTGTVAEGNDTRFHSPVTVSGAPTYVTLTGQDLVRALINLTSHVTGTLPIGSGGTGNTTAAAAFTALKQAASTTATGVVELATSAETTAGLVIQASDTRIHDPVTVSGTPNYVTLSGQDIVRALVNLSSHVTGTLPFASVAGRTAVTESGTTHTNAATDRDKWIRFTGTSAKTWTISSGVAAATEVWMFLNVGAGNLSLVGSGVTLTGNLIFAPLNGGFIYFTATNAADVIGGTAT